MKFEETREEFLLSNDKSLLDTDVIHEFLTNCYWAKGISKDVVQRSIDNSECFGVYHGTKQVGFARVISDKATIGYLGDVFVIEEYRGKGLSKWLMESVMNYPDFIGFRRWILLTRDAHELYKKYGFTPVAIPDRYMEIAVPDIYTKGKK